MAVNLGFLVAFGAAVENQLRPLRFLLLVGLSALAGDVLYLAFASGIRHPLVGADGGITGVMAFWALAFPRARVSVYHSVAPLWTHFPDTSMFYKFSLSARAATVLWLGYQLFGLLLWTPGGIGFNPWVPLGGALVGWLWWRPVDPLRERASPRSL